MKHILLIAALITYLNTSVMAEDEKSSIKCAASIQTKLPYDSNLVINADDATKTKLNEFAEKECKAQIGLPCSRNFGFGTKLPKDCQIFTSGELFCVGLIKESTSP